MTPSIEIDASDYDHFSEVDFVLARDPVLWAHFDSLPLFYDRSPWLDCAECRSPETELDPSRYPDEPAIVCLTCGAVTEGK